MSFIPQRDELLYSAHVCKRFGDHICIYIVYVYVLIDLYICIYILIYYYFSC